MLARTEPARAAVYAAAVTGDPVEIAAAKLLADEAAVRNARDCLQIHGGMGFTWEADVHLHLKRAWLRAASWLTGAGAEELLAADLGAAGPLPRSSAAPGRPVPEAGGAEGDTAHPPGVDTGLCPLRDSSPGGVGARLGYAPWDASGSGTGRSGGGLCGGSGPERGTLAGDVPGLPEERFSQSLRAPVRLPAACVAQYAPRVLLRAGICPKRLLR